MTGPSYPAARVVAERIQARLAESTTAFRDSVDAPKPDAVVIEEVISNAFWASLLREEGKSPTISLAFVPPEQVDRPLTFGTRLRLDPNVLARLAPAVERPGIHCSRPARGEVPPAGTDNEVCECCRAGRGRGQVHRTTSAGDGGSPGGVERPSGLLLLGGPRRIREHSGSTC